MLSRSALFSRQRNKENERHSGTPVLSIKELSMNTMTTIHHSFLRMITATPLWTTSHVMRLLDEIMNLVVAVEQAVVDIPGLLEHGQKVNERRQIIWNVALIEDEHLEPTMIANIYLATTSDPERALNIPIRNERDMLVRSLIPEETILSRRATIYLTITKNGALGISPCNGTIGYIVTQLACEKDEHQ